MRIECPGCMAAYEVREALLPPGREARCARCGRAWVPVPLEGGPDSETRDLLPSSASTAEAPPPRRPLPLRVQPRLGAPVEAPQLPPPPEEPPPPPPSLVAPLLAWAMSLLVVAGALAAFWIWRAELVAVWPPAGRLVQALGG